MNEESAKLSDVSIESLGDRARALTEALPYIHEFRGATIVIKYGGHAMVDPDLKQSVVRDLILMEAVGMKPVVVHGGGPDITRLMDRLGKKPEFVEGLRVTDQETMELTEMVLAGKLNGELVNLVNRSGGRAVGLSGKDAGLIAARKMGGEGKPDIGFVGEITAIRTEILEVLDEHHFIPIISPIGGDDQGNSYNINADTVAAEVAKALRACKLILLTDVRGVQRDPTDPSTLISTIERGDVEPLVKDKVIAGGMIPKVRACADALDRGVGKTHIVDGRVEHAILLELFTDHGIGTQIVSRQ
ncbi:acetylglutamate kinase [Candidatus Sumerlaeota bacterium]|nr:acetylglutamate kinase [Candidatus Sumerlaeota bacterium]